MKLNNLSLRKKIICCLCASITLSSVTFMGCSKKHEEKNKKNIKIETETNKRNIEKENKSNIKENEEKKPSKETSVKKEEGKKMFLKKELGKSAKPTFSTKWKNSNDNKFSACIEGKGIDALEEGVGKIYIKDLENKSQWELELDEENKKHTPKYIDWFDNENLMVVVSGAHGTVSQGGNLYKVNIKTGQATELYNTKDLKKQVIYAAKKGDKIELQLMIYEDDNFLESHVEPKTITVK